MFNAEELRVGPLKYFKDEYIHLHPIVGFLAKHSGLIRNMRFFGNYEKGMLGEKREYAKDRTVESDPIWNIIRILYPSTSGELTTVANCASNFGAIIADATPVLDLIIYITELRKMNDVLLTKMSEKANLYKAGNPTQELYMNTVKPLDAQIINIRNVMRSTKATVESKYNKFEEMRVLLDCIFNLVTKRDKSEAYFGYPKFIIEQILISYLWIHFDTVDAINLYMNGLPDEFFASQESSLHAHLMDIIEYCEEKNSRQGQTPYTSHPIENGNCYVYNRSKDEFLTTTFADCVENTIRHVVTLFLWNPIIQKYRKTDIPAVDFFFDKLKNPNDGNIGIRSRWNRVVCDLNNMNEFLMLPKDENVIQQIISNSKKWNNTEEGNNDNTEDELLGEKLAPVSYVERISGIEYNTRSDLYNMAAIMIKIFGMHDRKITKYAKQLYDAPEESVKTNNICRLFELIFIHISQNPDIKIKCCGEQFNVRDNRCYGGIHVTYAIGSNKATKFILDSLASHGRIRDFDDTNLQKIVYRGESYSPDLSKVFIPFFLKYSGGSIAYDDYYILMGNTIMIDNKSYASFILYLNEIEVTKTLYVSIKHVLVEITWNDLSTLEKLSLNIHSAYSSNPPLRPIFDEHVRGYCCDGKIYEELYAFRNLETLSLSDVECPDLSDFSYLSSMIARGSESIDINSENSALEVIYLEQCTDVSLKVKKLNKLISLESIECNGSIFIALGPLNVALRKIIVITADDNNDDVECIIDFDLRQCSELMQVTLDYVTVRSLIFGSTYTKLGNVELKGIVCTNLELDLREAVSLRNLVIDDTVIKSVSIGRKNIQLDELDLTGKFDVYIDPSDCIELVDFKIANNGIFDPPLDIDTKKYPRLRSLWIKNDVIVDSLIMSPENKELVDISIDVKCVINLDLRHYKNLECLHLGKSVKTNPLIIDHNHHELDDIIISSKTIIDLNLQNCTKLYRLILSENVKINSLIIGHNHHNLCIVEICAKTILDLYLQNCSKLNSLIIGKEVTLNSLILPNNIFNFNTIDIRAKGTLELNLIGCTRLIRLFLGRQLTLTSLHLPSSQTLKTMHIDSVGNVDLNLQNNYSALKDIYLGELLTGSIRLSNNSIEKINILGRIRIYAYLIDNKSLKSIHIGKCAYIHKLEIGEASGLLEHITIHTTGEIDLDLANLHNLHRVILSRCTMSRRLVISSNNPSLETIDVRGIQVSVNRKALKNLKTFNVS